MEEGRNWRDGERGREAGREGKERDTESGMERRERDRETKRGEKKKRGKML